MVYMPVSVPTMVYMPVSVPWWVPSSVPWWVSLVGTMVGVTSPGILVGVTSPGILVGILAGYPGGYTSLCTMVGILAYVPWWVYTPWVYVPGTPPWVHHPGYTSRTPAVHAALLHGTADQGLPR